MIISLFQKVIKMAERNSGPEDMDSYDDEVSFFSELFDSYHWKQGHVSGA